MHRGHRRKRWGVALAIGASIAGVTATTARARAGTLPGCEAGATCADGDGDGFVACSCAAAGTPCDCDDSDPRAFPGAPEACDATKDLDCSGGAGRACGAKKGCLRGVCVPECIPLDDFGCAPYAHCETQADQRLCTGDCSIYGCPPGSTCDDTKTCRADCNADVRCPFGQLCRGFGCVDPCDGVACAEGATCKAGRCVGSCDCSPGNTGCASGEVCERVAPAARCVEEACVGVACLGGSHCAGGACVEDCAGVVCPPKEVCLRVTNDAGLARGSCVDRCAPNPCASPQVCDWRTGTCLAPTFPEAGLEPFSDAEPQPEVLVVGGAGLSCTMGGLGRVSMFGGGASALAFALLMARRAARRRSDRST